jgi:hypothetical protein
VVRLDAAGFLADRRDRVAFIRDLLAATASRPAHTGCFGLHEWAMVYRQPERRHPLPLRLGRAGTDAVVEAHPIRCTHFDAYRFFTPEAAPLNRVRPTRAAQADLEQPGCLHAAMDCHKWATKLGPAVPGDLALDCFTLARDIRLLDMRASPYDLSAYGAAPVKIETPEGKAAYVAGQRAFAERASGLRARLLAVCDRLLGAAGTAAAGAEAAAGFGAAGAGYQGGMTQPDRAERRAAHLLPEERAAGSADPRAQAEVILDESDIRESDRTAAPDSFVEHRTSEQAAD